MNPIISLQSGDPTRAASPQLASVPLSKPEFEPKWTRYHPMKVIFWHSTYHPSFSGHALQMDRLRQRLRARGLDAEIWVRAQASGPTPSEYDGFRVRTFGPADESRWAELLRLLKVSGALIAAAPEYDVFQLSGLGIFTQLLSLAPLLLGKPVVAQMTLMGSDDPLTLSTGRLTSLKRALHARFDRWVSLGGALTGAYQRSGLPSERLSIIPVAVDLTRFAPVEDKRPLRRALGLPEERLIVVMVGHIIRRKGYDVLVEAMPQVLSRVPHAHFVFVGPEEPITDPVPLGKWITARVAELGIAEHLSRPGRTPRVPEYLQAADVFVFPSRQEGLPNAVLEAQACGLPVVMSQLEGVAEELIQPGIQGLVAPIGDAETLAQHLCTVLLDPALRARMGTAGRAQIEARYNLERIADQWMALYQHLCQDRSAAWSGHAVTSSTVTE